MVSGQRALEEFRDGLLALLSVCTDELMRDPEPPAQVARASAVLARVQGLVPEVVEACRDDRGRPYAMRDLSPATAALVKQTRHQVEVLVSLYPEEA